MGELVPVCGDEPFRSVATLPEWAMCNFTVLVFIVFVTIMVLFIIAMVAIVSRFATHRKI
jgi:hypothetical protein